MTGLKISWTYMRREWRRNLNGGLRGFTIFFLCLILGVASISGVRSLSSSLLDALAYNGKYILGGDIALRNIYTPPTSEQIKFLKRNIGPTTTVIETRAMARRQDEARASLVELKAVDVFYPLYGHFEYRDQTGDMRQETVNTSADLLPSQNGTEDWGAYIETQVSENLGVEIGDLLLIGDQNFIIRGVIEHEPDRLGSERFTYAPRVMISQGALDKTGLIRPGSQIYYDTKVALFGEEQFEKLEDVQKEITEAFPDARWKGRNYFNASPRIESFIERLMVFLSLVGLMALLVGGVGMGNAVRAYLENNYAAIATFKSLGASRALVFKMYFLKLFVLGLIGSVIGCAIGASVPYISLPFLADALSLKTYNISFYGEDYLISIVFGLLTMVLFTLYPLARACHVKAADLFRQSVQVTEFKPSFTIRISGVLVAVALIALVLFATDDNRIAIGFVVASVFMMGLFGALSFLLKKMLRYLKPKNSPSVRLALSNLYRPGNLTQSLTVSLGLGLTVFVIVGLIEYNFTQKISNNLNENTPAFFFLDVQSDQVDNFEAAIKSIPSATKLKMTPQVRGRVKAVNGVPAKQAIVNESEAWVMRGDRGFTYTTELPDNSEIIAGEWWSKDYKGDPIISISEDVAIAFDIGIGDEITINILGFDITAKVANVRVVDWGSFAMNFAITFAPGALDDVPATWLATVVMDEADEMQTQVAIAKGFPNVSAVRIRDTLELADQILKGIAKAVRAAAILMLLSGVLVLGGAIASRKKQRLYDAVVFKTIGIERPRIFKIFIFEYLILGVLAASVASLVGTALAYVVLTAVMDFGWAFNMWLVVSILFGALVFAFIFGAISTWRILGVKPAGYLRNE